MKLNQRAYVENMMRDHKIEPREWRAMLPPDLDMDKACGTELLSREGISEYLSLLQTLHWVARCTRWDVQTKAWSQESRVKSHFRSSRM